MAENSLAGPPAELDGARVLYWANVAALQLSGAIRHYRDGILQERFARIAITQYSGDTGAYLFHCDASWKVENDDLYDSTEEALDAALSQYLGLTRDALRRIQGTVSGPTSG